MHLSAFNHLIKKIRLIFPTCLPFNRQRTPPVRADTSASLWLIKPRAWLARGRGGGGLRERATGQASCSGARSRSRSGLEMSAPSPRSKPGIQNYSVSLRKPTMRTKCLGKLPESKLYSHFSFVKSCFEKLVFELLIFLDKLGKYAFFVLLPRKRKSKLEIKNIFQKLLLNIT